MLRARAPIRQGIFAVPYHFPKFGSLLLQFQCHVVLMFGCLREPNSREMVRNCSRTLICAWHGAFSFFHISSCIPENSAMSPFGKSWTCRFVNFRHQDIDLLRHRGSATDDLFDVDSVSQARAPNSTGGGLHYPVVWLEIRVI